MPKTAAIGVMRWQKCGTVARATKHTWSIWSTCKSLQESNFQSSSSDSGLNGWRSSSKKKKLCCSDVVELS